ncbi:NTP/NDP exchange transporter [Azotobacter beijerinckii]|uniref:ATP:ADP antiporter, AAA family n=1 Tax=Azotobacter beijerinckii TaxID=170623 RepID=A0A1I4EAR8_9GAMM|nr:MFS transporter [Azotobacter beijerinckii]SFA96781.1 ATP:ADP antiporter, AAA family [Azotobacter beijerinckii]SFL02878.1 ATP:ADP antiporter, AAA family [Azotobacter beijerinckii]
MQPTVPSLWQRLTGVRPEEAPAVLWSMLYVIALFLAYYVLRPIRDELGVAGGVQNLPWLFTGTLVAMLVVSPLFALAVRNLPRRQFIALAYRFFAVNLFVFALLLQFAGPDWQVWVGRAFFIWVSVFNLFVVSVFWSFIVDIFDSEQGKRLFGLLAAGATIGGILGSALTSGLVENIGRSWLIAISIVLLEMAVLASRRLSVMAKAFERPARNDDPSKPLGGGIFAGFVHTIRSPYLAGLALFILLYSITSTFLYFQQANIAQAYFPDRAARTAFFANIDLLVNAITLFLQLFVTGRLIGSQGIVATLAILPLVSVAGFTALAASPGTAVLVVAQVARRAANFALARPAREILFTSSAREDRYKAKNFIDTVIYRGGDQVASWGYAGLMGLGLGLTQMAVIAVPVSVAWLALSIWLGRSHQKQEASAAQFNAAEQPLPADNS